MWEGQLFLLYFASAPFDSCPLIIIIFRTVHMSGEEPTINDMIKALPLAEKVPVLALKKLLD